MKKYKAVVFIDSCFWHGCKMYFKLPKTRKKFWKSKIERNIYRDKQVNKFYRCEDWKVLRVWEYKIEKNVKYEINRVCKFIALS